jgi:hypothetical protein
MSRHPHIWRRQDTDGIVTMQAYDCPVYFTDDWLNDYHDLLRNAPEEGESQANINTSDYRFVYLGREVNAPSRPHSPPTAVSSHRPIT